MADYHRFEKQPDERWTITVSFNNALGSISDAAQIDTDSVAVAAYRMSDGTTSTTTVVATYSAYATAVVVVVFGGDDGEDHDVKILACSNTDPYNRMESDILMAVRAQP